MPWGFSNQGKCHSADNIPIDRTDGARSAGMSRFLARPVSVRASVTLQGDPYGQGSEWLWQPISLMSLFKAIRSK